MHMADALLSPAVAATMYVASGTAATVSIKRLTIDEDAQKLPTMAVASALVFAGQMINYTIPGTGSSGHLCGGMLLSALLGPEAGFLSMIVVLTIQCLFFADGGLMALGANIWNMAFYGCFVGYYLIWRPIMRSRLFEGLGPKAGQRARIIAASIIGCVITLQMGAFSVVLETTLSGITELPFGAFCALMLPIHLAIGLVEGLITSAVLCFVYAARPELIRDVDPAAGEAAVFGQGAASGRKSLVTVIVSLAVLALL
ncbi:MAG TPA: cobalamin biosynthesis protein CbiM, partial [Lachnospiraceae bacterium]|nr:cobalamin biosynthesis protein CbiM [Lachnospiraceae bacterium]